MFLTIYRDFLPNFVNVNRRMYFNSNFIAIFHIQGWPSDTFLPTFLLKLRIPVKFEPDIEIVQFLHFCLIYTYEDCLLGCFALSIKYDFPYRRGAMYTDRARKCSQKGQI